MVSTWSTRKYCHSKYQAPQHNITHLKVITASQHQEIPTVSGDIDENDQISKERLQSPRLAWIDPPSTSAYVQNQSPNIDEDVQEPVGWQHPSLWLQSQCFPPTVPNFVEKIKKYCEDLGSFQKNSIFFSMIIVIAYPYFVKLKLDNFYWLVNNKKNKTEVTSVKLVLFKSVMSFETLTKVDRLAEIC